MIFLPASENWPVPQTAYERDALAFCRLWKDGQMSFELSTSGSTGMPKSIILSRYQMIASARLTGRTFGLNPGDRALACLNIRYIAGVMMLVRGIELGLELVLVEPKANPLHGLSRAERLIDFAAFVPLQLQTILVDERRNLPALNRMKAILVGGAAVDSLLSSRLQGVSTPVFNTYGMTETVSHIALRRVNGPETTEVFQALEGIEIGVDGRSCLSIRAPSTNGQLIQTNDVVELLEVRQFRLLGRVDLVINSGGVKIHPELIENIVGTFFQRENIVSRFFIGGFPDTYLGQRVILVVERIKLSVDQITQISQAIRSRLGSYFIPKQVLTIETFAETPTGKIDRTKTLETFLHL